MLSSIAQPSSRRPHTSGTLLIGSGAGWQRGAIGNRAGWRVNNPEAAPRSVNPLPQHRSAGLYAL